MCLFSLLTFVTSFYFFFVSFSYILLMPMPSCGHQQIVNREWLPKVQSDVGKFMTRPRNPAPNLFCYLARFLEVNRTKKISTLLHVAESSTAFDMISEVLSELKGNKYSETSTAHLKLSKSLKKHLVEIQIHTILI